MDDDPDGFLDVSRMDFQGDVDEQVAMLLQHVRLNRAEVIGLRNLLCDLEHALRSVWPGCEVNPFGSIVTGLGIKTSDVDVYVRIPHSRHIRPNPVNLARNVLRSAPWIFGNVFSIPWAKVPIVKFLHIPTGCNCDVNFHSESGVRNSKLIFHLLRTDPRALSLTILVKYWSKVFRLTGTNLLPNYALTMLVIFYLQQVKMLKSVMELQWNVEPYMVEGWNTAFDKNASQPEPCRDNIYHLLGGFFKYYSKFRFDQNVVCTYLGTSVLRTVFGGPDHSIPEDFYLYKENLKGGFCQQLRIDTLLCIQDPFELSRNCATAISQKLFSKIQACIEHGALLYEQKSPDDFLKELFRQDFLHTVKAPNHSQHKHVANKVFKNNKHNQRKTITNIARKYFEKQKHHKKGNVKAAKVNA